MVYRILLAACLTTFLAACGGGSSRGNAKTGGTSAEGTAAMAKSFSTELTKVQDCVQGEIDGKGPCNIDAFNNPVTVMCNDIRTTRPNANFPGADYSKFTKTCSDWSSVLGVGASEKITKITAMENDLQALQ